MGRGQPASSRRAVTTGALQRLPCNTPPAPLAPHCQGHTASLNSASPGWGRTSQSRCDLLGIPTNWLLNDFCLIDGQPGISSSSNGLLYPLPHPIILGWLPVSCRDTRKCQEIQQMSGFLLRCGMLPGATMPLLKNIQWLPRAQHGGPKRLCLSIKDPTGM